MEVSCPRCDTLYELDVQQVRGPAVTLKCSQCEHLFRLETSSDGRDESAPRWMVRRVHAGDILYFTGFDSLYDWIIKGKVSAEDSISRSGDRWTQLIDIGEFSPIFQVVASVADLTSTKAKREEARERELPERTAERVPKSTPPPRQRQKRSTPRPRRSTEPDHQTSRRPRTRTAPHHTPSAVPAAGSSPVAPERSSRKQTATPAPERPSPERPKKPSVNLQDRRFEEKSKSPKGQVTLGEMERVATPGDKSGVTRRWPLILVIVLGVAAAGVWKGNEGVAWVQQMLDGREAPHRPAKVTAGEELTEQGEGAIPRAAQEVESSRQAGQRAADVVAFTMALRPAQDEVGAAHQTGEQAASAAVQRALRTPDDWVQAGRRSLDRGNAAQALERFDRALEAHAGHAGATVGRGWAYLSMQDTDGALREFRRAIRQDPSMGEALIGIGRAERNQGNPQAALQAYEDYLERFPNGSHASIARYQSQQLREQLQ